MFRKLRNRLIFINLSITSLVILVVFTSIYVISTHSANQRPPVPENSTNYSGEVEELIEDRIQNEKNIAARELLVILIVSGIAIDLIVAFVSYYLAEEAIKPVREAYEAQKVFIANASHEIKTPLAAIAANLEAADIKDNKWISNVEKETAKLTELNGELLSLARTDLITDVSTKEVDLTELTEKSLESMKPRMIGIKFEKDIMATGRIKINAADFIQILEILIDNAIKYSNKRIDLTLNSHELIVANDGATISEKDLPHIFERFYQADKSAGGVGLGLSIAKSLADRNGRGLTVESKDNKTKFTLKF
ncbi:MAG: HAMP domain-containing sensor histidine kinase [Candidatus Saccharibacteria bacterium]|nr:HAMP domain-containing sensor histidine kinase [Candidatus Saccharibacteria bacterium]